MKKLALLILGVMTVVSCTTKSTNDAYKIPFIEMTIDSLSRYFPDDFLNTGNISARTVNISKIKNTIAVYEDSYTFDSINEVLTSMRNYSDGDYYITEFGFDKSRLVSEIKYIDNTEKKILHSFSFVYTNVPPTIDVIDGEQKIVRTYKIILNKNETIIQLINNSKELSQEYIYIYENDKLISITNKSPRINTILKTNIHYYNDLITKTELYSESNEDHRLLSKKEYQYDHDSKLIGLTQTNYHRSEPPEIFKTAFIKHDANGNWTVSQSDDDILYKREIVYSLETQG